MWDEGSGRRQGGKDSSEATIAWQESFSRLAPEKVDQEKF